MKFRPNRTMSANIALASALVLAFAGCQVAPQAPTGPDAERTMTTGGKGKVGTAKPGEGGEAASEPTAEANAKVMGRVIDTDGNPIAGADITAAYGFHTTTDADGKYTFELHSDQELRLDIRKSGFLERQVMTGVAEGMEADLGTVTLKKLDAKLSKVGAKGGTITNSDGSSILEIPEGALEGDVDVRLTWMDPIPSDKFPTSYGELPGPLLTRTQPNGAGGGETLVIPPLAFTAVDMEGGQLKPGAQATLKMKVNPAALELAGDNIDFDNPVTLQQPCYDYDPETGLWVNPATSKLEKDANGDVWFVYTLRASDAPKNYKPLSHVSGQKRVYWREWEQRTRTRSVWQSRPGGGGSWVTVTETYWVSVTRSRLDNLYGRHFSGTVREQSSYGPYNGKGISGATVFHNSDFYGSTTKTTGGNGGFDIPMWHNSGGVGVNGSTWRGAGSTGGGYNMSIPTDGSIKYHIQGGSLQLNANRSNVRSGARGASNAAVTEVAARDSQISFAAPAAPLYVRNASGGQARLSGDVPVRGQLDFGVLKVARDWAGLVRERVTTSPDNGPAYLTNPSAPSRSRLATDLSPLPGTTVNGFTDTFTGANSLVTGADGRFSFALLGNATAPDVTGSFQGLRATDNSPLDTINSAASDAQGQPYTLDIRTDSSYTLTLTGVFSSADAGKEIKLTYLVDGGTFEKTVTIGADGKATLTFARDTADNKLEVKFLKAEGDDMVSDNLPQPTNLSPGGSASGEIEMRFKSAAVKYKH